MMRFTVTGAEHNRLASIVMGHSEADELPASPRRGERCFLKTQRGARLVEFVGDSWIEVAELVPKSSISTG